MAMTHVYLAALGLQRGHVIGLSCVHLLRVAAWVGVCVCVCVYVRVCVRV